MFDDPKGPIQHYSWSEFIIMGEEHSQNGDRRLGKGKDIFLNGTKVRRWKERKGHLLDQDMVQRAVDQNIEFLIIGNGANGALMVPDKVIDYLKTSGIKKIVVEKTPEACRLYNKLFHEGKHVALFAHGTC